MGNPLKSEGAAFRWLVAVLAGAGLVILCTVLISSAAGAAVGFVLLVIVAAAIVKGMIHMLGSPDEDAPGSGGEPAEPGGGEAGPDGVSGPGA